MSLAVCTRAGTWNLVWSDEFNDVANSPPDPANWTFDIGGGGFGNGELQYYTNRTVNVRQNGTGSLVIEALQEAYMGNAYTSARIKSQGIQEFLYGRMEARIQIPGTQGIWPAFWMLGNNIGAVGWPTCGEIDIMENVGFEPNRIHGTVHGPGYSGAGGIGGPYDLAQPYMNAYHIFEIQWQPNRIDWFMDGIQYFSITPADLGGNAWVYDHPHFFILNVAVGGAWPGNPDGSTVFPQQMLVDYVRVYEEVVIPGPYNGSPAVIAGRIEVEEFDIGGQGTAFSDNDAANLGGQMRLSEGVDIEATTDPTGGNYNVGWTEGGEWLDYEVQVLTTGLYQVDFRVAIAGAGGVVHLEFDGLDVTGPVNIPDTGGWQAWQTLTLNGIALTAGVQEMRLVMDSPGTGGSVGNFNYIDFTLEAAATPTSTRTPVTTATYTRTSTPTVTLSATPTLTVTYTVTRTATQTVTATTTLTATPTSSLTVTPTITLTYSDTTSPTVSVTAPGTFTHSPTITVSPTNTQTFTITATSTVTGTETPSTTQTYTASSTPASTATSTPTPSFTASYTSSWTPTASFTSTLTPTFTASLTFSPGPSFTASPTVTAGPTFTATATVGQVESINRPVIRDGVAAPNPLRGSRVQLLLDIDQPADKLVCDVYSRGYSKVARVVLSGVLRGPGWVEMDVELNDVVNGTYYAVVKASNSFGESRSKPIKILILR